MPNPLRDDAIGYYRSPFPVGPTPPFNSANIAASVNNIAAARAANPPPVNIPTNFGNPPYGYTPPPPAPSYSAPVAPASTTPGWAQPWEAMGLSPEYMMRWGGAANDNGGGQPAPQPQYSAPPPIQYPAGWGSAPGIPTLLPPAASNPLAPGQPPISAITPQAPGYNSLDIPEELYSFVPEPLRQQFGGSINAFLQRLGFRGTGNVGRYGERSYAFPAGTSQPYFSPDMFGYIQDPYIRSLIQYLFGERGQSARIPLPAAPVMA